MLAMFLPLIFLLLVGHQNGVSAQMQVSVTTFDAPAGDGAPNTFVGTGSQIASSLLGSDTPALLWGVISSSDVNAVCQHILNTGYNNFSATVNLATASSLHTSIDSVNVEITEMEGCLAESDATGIEAVVAASDGRQAAVICPKKADSTGCGLYFTGDDVNGILSRGKMGGLFETTSAKSKSRKLLDACNTGAQKGATSGAITGALDAEDCIALGPLAPFCVAGVMGVGAWIGAAVGCGTGSAGIGSGGCFPGDATVLLANGDVKHMAGLALGQKVAVLKQDGSVDYEDIYAFGHKDASASGHYIQLSTKSLAKGANLNDSGLNSELESRTLKLTPLHFAQVSSGLEGKISYKRAQDIKVGDFMWAQPSKAEAVTSLYQVTGVSTVVKQGLYNPFTLSGTIIVDGVAASTHSEWFLDSTFDFLGWTHRLPSAYQTILSPVRALYFVLGQDAYISLYHQLDALISIADFGTNYGGQLIWSLTTASTSSVFAALVIWQLSKARGSN